MDFDFIHAIESAAVSLILYYLLQRLRTSRAMAVLIGLIALKILHSFAE